MRLAGSDGRTQQTLDPGTLVDMFNHNVSGVRPAALLTMMSVLPRGEAVDALARHAMTHHINTSPQGTPLLTNASAEVVAQLASLGPALPFWAQEFLVGLQQEDALAEVHAQWPAWHWAQAALYLNPVAHRMGLAPSAESIQDLARRPSSELRHARLMLPTAVAQYAALGVPTPPLRDLAETFAVRSQGYEQMVGRILSKAWAWPFRPAGAEHVIELWVAAAWQQATKAEVNPGHVTQEYLERNALSRGDAAAQSHTSSYGGTAYENPWVEEVLFRPECTHWEMLIGSSTDYTGGRKHIAGNVLGRRLRDVIGDDSGAWITAVQLLEQWDHPLDQWLELLEALQ